MKYSLSAALGCLVMLLTNAQFLAAQTSYRIASDDTEFSVSGTSSLHNWTMNLETGKSSGSAAFDISGNTIQKVDGLKIQVETKGLKSGKEQMDDNTYKALKAETHAHITFEAGEIGKIKAEGAGYLIETSGKLTIAGVTRPIDLAASCTVGGSAVTCTGSKAIKMTDFEIDPPTAMFGSLKTGDDITINFKAVFKR